MHLVIESLQLKRQDFHMFNAYLPYQAKPNRRLARPSQLKAIRSESEYAKTDTVVDGLLILSLALTASSRVLQLSKASESEEF